MAKIIHYLQHVHFEDMGFIEQWALQNGFSVSSTKLFEGEALPSVDSFDWLVIMGGSMSVGDVADNPWLVEEYEFIRSSIERKIPVLGICLGAQLIAHVLGAEVYASGLKEIGWWDVQNAGSATDHKLSKLFEAQKAVFQWHGDTFTLPDNAVLLASSEACVNQAFVYDDSVVALQFHLETTKQSIKKLLTYSAGDLSAGKYVQTVEQINSDEINIESSNQLMSEILNYLNSIK